MRHQHGLRSPGADQRHALDRSGPARALVLVVALLCATGLVGPVVTSRVVTSPVAVGAEPVHAHEGGRLAGPATGRDPSAAVPSVRLERGPCADGSPCTAAATARAAQHRRLPGRWAEALRVRRGRSLAGSSSQPDRAGIAADLVLADFWTEYVEASSSRWRFIAQHPRECVGAVRAMSRLAVVGTGRLSGPEGRMVADAVRAPSFLGVPIGRLGMAVLDVPVDATSYLLGPSRATVRRKVRAATKDGTVFRPVLDPAERRALRLLADGCEQAHRDDRYRVDAPDNTDLEDVGLWLVAESPEGVPLLLVVAPVGGSTAVLRYFRTLGAGPAHSNARYLGTAVLVEELAHRGVRHLVDPMPPGELTNGLRHFQRMVGFRYRRVVTG